MALKRTNEFYDLIDDAIKDPNLDVATRALEVCRAHIGTQAKELGELRAAQRNHERQLAERDVVIKALREEVESLGYEIQEANERASL